jgi:BirA family transcriptional regulator, biotin operon repressor / biotin---[acetyl-CoA-carboxylase] ligase
MFDLPALKSALAGTIFAGKLHFAPVTDSTNTDALQAARSGAPHGSVYFADEQLAGRGRSNHTWHSAAGEGLYVSVLLRPNTFATALPMLPLITGLAAASAINEVSGLTVDLRWPNDLLIGPRKTGGILVEARTEAGNIAYAVVGIGINVHQREFAAGLATPATSLDLESGAPSDRSTSHGWESGQRISRQQLLTALLKSLELELRSLYVPQAFEMIPRQIEKASTWVRGKQVVVHGPQACTGVTAGLDQYGFLRVQTENGLVTVQTGGLRAAENESADIS